MAIIAAIIEKIVIRIASEASTLTDHQRRGFTEWLIGHCKIERINVNKDLRLYLTVWFEGLPAEKVIQELLLFLTEISWWRKMSPEEIYNVNSSSRHTR